jgi:hypothetical protein
MFRGNNRYIFRDSHGTHQHHLWVNYESYFKVKILWYTWCSKRAHKFSEQLPPLPNSLRQNDDTKPYWGPKILGWPVNLTVIWRFLFGASERIHIFVRTIKLQQLRHRTKFSRPILVRTTLLYWSTVLWKWLYEYWSSLLFHSFQCLSTEAYINVFLYRVIQKEDKTFTRLQWSNESAHNHVICINC